MSQQPALALDAAAIAGQRAVAADDAVAGDDDADGIVAIGMADGAHGRLAPDALGERAIGKRPAAGDLAQGLPDLALEGRAAGRDRQAVDGVQLAVEIGPDRRAEARGIRRPAQRETLRPVMQPQRALQAVLLI